MPTTACAVEEAYVGVALDVVERFLRGLAG
jgi:hypothetical protein